MLAMRPQVGSGLTYDDLAELFPGEDNVRRELIGGELIVTPSPTVRHQRAVGVIFAGLREQALQRGGEAFVAPLDVVLTERDVVEPDVLYVGPGKDDPSEGRFLRSADLVVEVSSPSTRSVDVVRKLRLFEQHGIPEYWVVDLEAERVEVYRLAKGRYGPPHVLVRGDRIASPLLPDLQLEVDEAIGLPSV